MKWDELEVGKCRWCQNETMVDHNNFCRHCYEFSESARGLTDQTWFYILGYIEGVTRLGPMYGPDLVMACKAAAMQEFGISEW